MFGVLLGTLQRFKKNEDTKTEKVAMHARVKRFNAAAVYRICCVRKWRNRSNTK